METEEQDPDTAKTHDLHSLIEAGQTEQLEAVVYELPSHEMAHALSRLDEREQAELLTALPPEAAAFVAGELSHPQAAEMLEELPADRAASILDELPSDEQADLVGMLDTRQAEAVLERMAPTEAEDARLLSSYAPESAGGLMITEYLSFYESMSIDDVLRDLRQNNEAYQSYDVQYVYVIDGEGLLRGVARLRDLVMTAGDQQVQQIMIQDPLNVSVHAALSDLEALFDKYGFYALPAVDEHQRLTGVVRRSSVEEALADRSERSLLKFGGIIGGEERRSMPLWSRAGRRLWFLLPNIVLNLLAASVIAFFQPTLERVVALAIFLPILSDMCGNSGFQASALSIRELALGVVKPNEVWRTITKEVGVAVINGMVLGVVLGLIAWGMRGDEFAAIGLVVGAALAVNNVLAVAIGGIVPLILKRLKLDPTMASGPILTTITDLCGFFFALGLTALIIA